MKRAMLVEIPGIILHPACRVLIYGRQVISFPGLTGGLHPEVSPGNYRIKNEN
jgi:hypothetical protein